jgi:hypothetical protein
MLTNAYKYLENARSAVNKPSEISGNAQGFGSGLAKAPNSNRIPVEQVFPTSDARIRPRAY